MTSGHALSSAEIAKRAKSNLALALACLPEARRRDMISFYAFCRLADDIADSATLSEEEKATQLGHWKKCVLSSESTGHAVLDEASDIKHTRYETFEQLQAYCYQVASVVGLVSIHIFGHKNPQAAEYAIQLGYALQMTNIIRDVGEDARETGRIYLPMEDLKAFQVTEEEILKGQSSERFTRLMDFEYRRARSFYDEAAKLLPPEDRDTLLASQMMGQIYSEILEKLKRTRFPVFDHRCRLSKPRKAWILGTYLIKGWLARQRA
jgi:phytoene synthase